jgi:squalene-hopene/tetraprenyl-beta-curcumene cyclase
MTTVLTLVDGGGDSSQSGTSALDLDAALERAKRALLARQRDDGSWSCDTDIGPVGLATQVIVESLYGALGVDDARAARVRFGKWQLPDGSFESHPHATKGSLTTTALSWAALLACGATDSDSSACRARAYVDAHGGLTAVARAFRERSDVAALYLVALGHLDGACLPAVPPGMALVPLERLLDRHVHAGNVMATLVVAALGVRYAPAPQRGLLAVTRQALESARIRDYLLRWQNADGSWNGSPFQSCLVLLGLHAAGAGPGEASIKRAICWLDGMKRRSERGLDVCAMDNDVWSTALCAMALHASGMHAESPALARAQQLLLDAQTRDAMPRANQRKNGARRTGGWPFQRGNTTMPDADDTGVVVAALAILGGERAGRSLFHALDEGVAWLRDMQNPDGGFPTFVWGLPSKKPGPMFLRDFPVTFDDLGVLASLLRSPPPELGDPSLEGVTGRVLWGLGSAGVGRDDPAVGRAVAFLQHQQCESGAWWGRWKVCYLAETATVLLGLGAVGEDMTSAYVRRAVSWVISRQNDDGGFGESHEAYRDPRAAGRGPSMAPVTAYVLLGLMAARDVPVDVLQRAASYLLATQRDDGLWGEGGWLHTFIPPDLLYTYEVPAHALPLLALAKLRGLGEGRA